MKSVRPAAKVFRVQIICDITLEYFRNVTLGARHYCFTTNRLELADRWIANEEDNLPASIQRDRIDGIIVQAKDQDFENRFAKLPIPVVNISNSVPKPKLPLVTQDDYVVGRLAAEHLIECGCAAFGFWGQQDSLFSDERRKGFISALKEVNPSLPCAEAENPGFYGESGAPLIRRMARWLKKQPLPLGVFTVMDTAALHLLRAAQSLGLRVPDDIAILGAGDDEFWVEFERIPLSSVRLPSKKIGFEAAALLDSLIRQKKQKAPDKHLPVTEVASRRSTDILFVKDKAVTQAISYIRGHASENIYVEQVVKAAGVSRSSLQLRFKKALGRTILDEIRTTRISYAKTLLRTSDMKIPDIAEACDFPNISHFHLLFRQHTNQTPNQYRASFRSLF